ncbi:aminotransferase class V-fold PLP-dependent enzyme [Sphingobacterium griseoflavum]|uniref:Aminotransferase class V domain-containing protein n=1 Tax=Sphingobacterium griseoflavum TaxID=1474952 RepID=A0ABQ3HVH1_9SPHI|nr:aminotransferase class V-fold PLP-dependent enzyme [Sphingobacterium griseoflavum]GHE38405.1 hypothetical protein GCM10017764_22230 [Sphingobacterium griseoflavum]
MPFKEYFDIPSDVTYLNTPGNGILPRQTKQWRAERERQFFDLNSTLRDQQADTINSVRAQLAEVFGAHVQQVFCTPNFSFGYNTLLDRLPKETKFLLLADDYPSLNYPVISRKFAYQTVDVSAQLEMNIRTAITQFKPDILALSIVQYISGIKVDLNFIQELKREFPGLLIIGDGTQLLGTEAFSFIESGFDAVGCSGYKWLLSGFGNGFLLLSEQFISFLIDTAGEIAPPKESMWAGKSLLQTFFEPGHQDTLSHGTLGQSLAFLHGLGFDRIEKHIAAIAQMAHQELANRKLLLPEVTARTVRSNLINIQVSPTHYPRLMEAGIKCFPRGSGIRIGIHLYNTVDDLHRLLQLIDRF